MVSTDAEIYWMPSASLQLESPTAMTQPNAGYPTGLVQVMVRVIHAEQVKQFGISCRNGSSS